MAGGEDDLAMVEERMEKQVAQSERQVEACRATYICYFTHEKRATWGLGTQKFSPRLGRTGPSLNVPF